MSTPTRSTTRQHDNAIGVMVNGMWLSRAEIDEKLAALIGVRP